MTDTLTETGSLYSAPVGMIYVFNLIVGTGALTMPKAFGDAGWLISILAVVALAFMSYLTVTFMIEAMSTANAVRRIQRLAAAKEGVQVCDAQVTSSGSTTSDDKAPLLRESGAESTEVDDERSPLLRQCSSTSQTDIHDPGLFNITERMEMGQMASMFFSRLGKNVFYISLVVYLYGDLAIYAAAVPKSLRDVACTYKLNHTSLNETNRTAALNDGDPCWPGVPWLPRVQAYRIFLAIFTVLVCPFIFFNIQKTKYMQFFTTVMRWLAFLMMIILAILYLARGHGQGHPKVANISEVPNLFGVCVYSFMCHHSLPSLITPMKKKSKLFSLLAMDYSVILAFYSVLSFTGIFAFPNDCMKDLYTLDFQPDNDCHRGMVPITTVKFIQYFLALFPVFTLTTNFPIIGVSLRNNLKTMFYKEGRTYRWSVDRLLFPMATIIPPVAIAFITDNIQFLVGITGSFAGSGIQYFVPASLVLLSRRHLKTHLGTVTRHKHMSPFRQKAWAIFVFIWASICIIFIGISHLISFVHWVKDR